MIKREFYRLIKTRIINKNDWQKIEHGLIQRIIQNLFLYDIYTNKYYKRQNNTR